MSLDISIGRGDNAPPPRWVLPFDPTGSDIVVTIDMPGGIELVLSVSDGDLTLDIPNKAVVWYVTAAQSALLPYTSLYRLRRVVTGGEIRYYAQGRLFGVDGPVGPSSVVVQIPGPQGQIGPIGPIGPPGIVAVYAAPLSTIGAVGQLAIDGNTGLIYGPKTLTGWPSLPFGSINVVPGGAGDLFFLF